MNDVLEQIGIDPDLWAEWMEMRKKKKCPNTPRAIKAIIDRLLGYKAEGMNPTLIIEEALINGWKTVYPTKSHGTGNKTTGADWLNREF